MPVTSPAVEHTGPSSDTEKVRTISGVSFKHQVTGQDLGCSGNLVDATAEHIESSLINFRTTYLPDGVTLSGQVAAECDGKVVSLTRMYQGKGQMTITRFASKVYNLDEVPTDIQQMAIDDKDGLRLGPAKLLIVEREGITLIEGQQLVWDELVRVAGSLR